MELGKDVLSQLDVDAATKMFSIGWRVTLELMIVGTDFFPHFGHVMGMIKLYFNFFIPEISFN